MCSSQTFLRKEHFHEQWWLRSHVAVHLHDQVLPLPQFPVPVGETYQSEFMSREEIVLNDEINEAVYHDEYKRVEEHNERITKKLLEIEDDPFTEDNLVDLKNAYQSCDAFKKLVKRDIFRKINPTDSQSTVSAPTIVIHPDIPENAYSNVVNVKGDGFCGFRCLAHQLYGDENRFWEVKKAMRDHLLTNFVTYSSIFHEKSYLIDELKRIVCYRISSEIGNSEVCEMKERVAPIDYWFMVPECAQLAACTFGRPIASYDLRHEPQTYLPILPPAKIDPPPGERPLPLLLYFPVVINLDKEIEPEVSNSIEQHIIKDCADGDKAFEHGEVVEDSINQDEVELKLLLQD
ncbi:unnamed protein product [Mucor hiemalis]